MICVINDERDSLILLCQVFYHEELFMPFCWFLPQSKIFFLIKFSLFDVLFFNFFQKFWFCHGNFIFSASFWGKIHNICLFNFHTSRPLLFFMLIIVIKLKISFTPQINHGNMCFICENINRAIRLKIFIYEYVFDLKFNCYQLVLKWCWYWRGLFWMKFKDF